MIKKRVFLGFAALAALSALSGCGGSGTTSLPVLVSGNLNFSGAPTGTGTGNSATVPATGGVSVTITLPGGATESAIVPSGTEPAGTVLPAGTQYAIIPSGVGFPTATALPANSQLTINGVASSGATISAGGLLAVNVALPVTPGAAGTLYTIAFPDATLSTSRGLTIGQIIFSGRYYYTPSGGMISPMPIHIAGSLPDNGTNAAGTTVLTTFGPGNANRVGKLNVIYGSNTGFHLTQYHTITLQKVAAAVSPIPTLAALYVDLVYDAQNVPSGGVQSVEFDVSDL